jgi:hypothetical protein
MDRSPALISPQIRPSGSISPILKPVVRRLPLLVTVSKSSAEGEKRSPIHSIRQIAVETRFAEWTGVRIPPAS